MERYHISGVPITDGDGRLVGLLTNRDLRFIEDVDQPIANVMRRPPLVTAPLGTTLKQAKDILWQHRIEKLPIVDDHGFLKGLITVKDIKKQSEHPALDPGREGPPAGRRRGGRGARRRPPSGWSPGVDVLVVDTAHGHSRSVLDAVKQIKGAFEVEVIAGNVAPARRSTPWPARAPTRSRSAWARARSARPAASPGWGALVTAIYDGAAAAARHGITVVADGGIQYSGDIAKAIAAGADSVMIGSLLAGVDESPGEVVLHQGERFKEYRGMGSMGAMKGRSYSKDRYFQGEIVDSDKLIPEGIEGRVAYKGPVSNVIHQLVGGCAWPWATAAPAPSPTCRRTPASCAATNAGRECIPTTSRSPRKPPTTAPGDRPAAAVAPAVRPVRGGRGRRGRVPVTNPSSWRSSAAVAPHTVSPTSSKKVMGRTWPLGNVQRSSRKIAGSSSSASGTCSTASTTGLGTVSARQHPDVGDDERAAGHRRQAVELADDLDRGGVEADLLVRLRRAPSTGDSPGSTRPPGKLTSPWWVRRPQVRRVSTTCAPVAPAPPSPSGSGWS